MTLTRKDVVDIARQGVFLDMDSKAKFLDKAAMYNGSNHYFYEDLFN